MAVVIKHHLQATVLLVCGHVLELRDLAHLVVDARTPGAQVFDRVGGELVLVRGVALAARHRKILRCLQEGRSAGELLELGPQAIDHCGGADTALLERLEDDETEAVVDGPATRAAATSGESENVLHGRIRLHHFLHRENGIAHGLKRGVLCTLQAALNAAGVLQGKKSFGYPAKEDDVQR